MDTTVFQQTGHKVIRSLTIQRRTEDSATDLKPGEIRAQQPLDTDTVVFTNGNSLTQEHPFGSWPETFVSHTSSRPRARSELAAPIQ